MNVKRIKNGVAFLTLAVLLITTTGYLVSCSNQQEVTRTEPDIIVGFDPHFTPQPDPMNNGRITAGETVILNKVRVWLGRGETPEGTFRIKVTRVSDSHVMATSKKINASSLKYIFDRDGLLAPGKVIFDLTETTVNLKAGTKYRVEVECSTVADSFDKSIIWGEYFDFQNIKGPYAPGTETARLIFADGTEAMRTPDTHADFTFETEARRSNGTTYTDQSQKKFNSFKSANGILFGEGEKKDVFGQEFVPSVR